MVLERVSLLQGWSSLLAKNCNVQVGNWMRITTNSPGIRWCQREVGWGQIKEKRLQVAPSIDFMAGSSRIPKNGAEPLSQWIPGNTHPQSVITFFPQYCKDTPSSHIYIHHFEEGKETPKDWTFIQRHHLIHAW